MTAKRRASKRYLTGCAELFRDGYTDLCQFTLEKR